MKILGIVYLVQVIIGVAGNIFLIYHYCFHFIIQNNPRRINFILIQLTFANAMFLLFRGIPTAIFSLGIKSFLNDAVCKILTYPQRVLRGLSLCSTCLLSGFQAIAISPNSPKWAVLKVKSSKGIIPCCFICWIINLLMDLAISIYAIGPKNNTKTKGRNKLDYCTLDPYALNSLKLQLWKSFYDSVLVALMAITSGYMVFLLYYHHKRVHHIHSTSLSPRISPETRAIKVILLLVGTFFFFNFICSIITIYTNHAQVTGPWMFYVPMLFSMGFQTTSPFVLISSEKWGAWEFCCFLQKMKD
ncbi:vomeronasal type-1 receptor 1-like [Macrotis lagotis]|uniref:vomeronasal type-1 receptor 1-like n=1 Tax=Macrotis lagotis TaxID=92651 RepID=UPI003D6953DB